MADKIKDSVLNSVVGGKDEGITYKYKSGDCFRSISGQFVYYEIIEPAGRIDEISNTPIYKCNMYVAYSIALILRDWQVCVPLLRWHCTV